MALPTNLFIEAPEMNDVSLQKLSQNIEEWPEEIVQKLKERIPRANGMNLIVKFMKKDEENGAATGSVTVGSASKVAIIPLIIKDFMMYPLDIMIADQKLLPLTPDYFDGVFSSNVTFQRLDEYPIYGGLHRFEDATLWNAHYPPSLGRYAYASAGFKICDELCESFDTTEFKNYLLANPGVATNFVKQGKADIIRALSNLRPVNMNEFGQGKENLVPRGIAMLRREGPNKYTLLQNADDVFSPVISQGLSRAVCCQHIAEQKLSDHAEDDINDVDQNGEKILAAPAPTDEVFLQMPATEEVEQANEFDHYAVKKRDGVIVEGYVIPKVINFDMEVMPLKTFIGKTMSTIQEEIAGVRVKNSSFKLKGHEPRPGQTGCFVYQLNESKALCTVPVTITSVVDDYGSLKMKATDLITGAPLHLSLSDWLPGDNKTSNAPAPVFQDLQRIARVPDGYILPSKFKWVPMEGFQEVTNSAVDYAAKTAAEKHEANPVQLQATGYGQFCLKGVDKYAQAVGWNPQNLDGYQARFLLASLGVGSGKIAEAVKLAERQGFAKIAGVKRLPLGSEVKTAAAAKQARRAEVFKKIAAVLKSNLTKEASFMENSQTVDALLSLNFVSQDNVMKFVGYLPSFKGAVSNLCSCLLASRLGMHEIPEQACSTAMYRLIDVINGLEKLRAQQEQGVGA